MPYSFDTIIERRGTSSLKYDFAAEHGHAADILPFWVADMDFQAPPAVVEELIRCSRHGIFGYTDAKKDYREILIKWFHKYHNWSPAANSLIITPGVVFAICASIRAFTKPGDAVLIQQPVYYPFSEAIHDNNRKLINSSLVLQNGHYCIDFTDFEQKIVEHNVKLFLLCSPQNPTGRVWHPKELTRIGEICLRHGVYVVADEIHHEFIREGFRHTVFASLSPEINDITITCTSPSKTFNLAGLQVSNIFIANRTLRHRFRHEVNAAGYSQPNALGLFASKAAYTHGAEWLKELRNYLEQNLQKTKAFLAQTLPKIHLIEPEGTYLLWLDFSVYGLSDEALDNIITKQAKIWLDSGHIFGPEGQGFQRINIACPWPVLEKGLVQLGQAFKDI
jgi:cysteine-S-conjugate beta-lyase